jgi:hypothetical protein
MIQNQVAPIDFSTAATQTVIPAVAGKRVIVYAYSLFNGVATGQSVQFKSGSNLLSGVMQLPAAVGGPIAASTGDQSIGLLMTDVSAGLTMTMSAATQVGGHISYKYV